MSDQPDSTAFDEEKLLRAAMDLAGSLGWSRCSLSAIATTAGMEEATLRRVHRDGNSILRALAARIDREILESEDIGSDDDIPVREALLELLMLRFDAMQPYKAGILAVTRSALGNPGMAIRGGCALAASMRATLAAAGVSVQGPAGLVRVKALEAIFLDAFRVWTRDDSPDLSATFRRLDGRLGQAESLALSIGLAKPARMPR